MSARKTAVILGHAFVGWAFCAATMGVGMTVAPLAAILWVHAAMAPIFFALVSMIYFKKFNYTGPLMTALIFTGFVMAVDFFIVALLINKSLAMFASLLGTWIPFALIFTSTYAAGRYAAKRSK